MSTDTQWDYVESAWRIYPISSRIGFQAATPFIPSRFGQTTPTPDDLVLVVDTNGAHWILGTLDAAEGTFPEVIDIMLIKYPTPLQHAELDNGRQA